MKNLKWIFLLLFFCSINSYALNGNQLLQLCATTFNISNNPNASLGDYASFAFCSGYLLGVSDSVNGVVFCAPQITTDQLIQVTTRYLNNHPTELNLNAFYLIYSALQQAFPCRKRTR